MGLILYTLIFVLYKEQIVLPLKVIYLKPS